MSDLRTPRKAGIPAAGLGTRFLPASAAVPKELAPAGEPGRGVVSHGRRYDTGDRAGYLEAVVRPASDRPDPGPEFRRLEDFGAGRA